MHFNFPISVYDFMNHALYNQEHGYYMKKTPMGTTNADFITAPELTPLFGEVITFWILNKIFEYSGKVNIVEFGPGRATMAKDILATIQKMSPAHFSNIDYYLIEKSPTLIKEQKLNLLDFNNIHHLEELTELNGLTIVLANEFFDALPVRQYKKVENKYFERLINDKYEFILADEPSQIGKEYVEDFVEIYPDANNYLEQIKKHSNHALIIDYGNLGTSETLQAIKKHQKVDIFSDIGSSDLTTQVDFRQIIKPFDGYAELNISNMGDFLAANGIIIRAEQLLENASAEQAKNLNYVLKKLIHPDEMGQIFKVLEISDIDN